ncbi:MAG: alpha/beta hydrolase-fold protein, partial [Verrucomicrobiota bacterium]
MKNRFLVLFSVLMGISMVAEAQISPEVGEDGTVTFRFRSKTAEKIEVRGQFGDPVALVRTEEEWWEGRTAEAVPPGIYEYRFLADEQIVIDPRNREVKPQRWPGTSILHIPSNPPALWDLQEIPHGVIHQHTYRSRALDSWRQVVVYTPPNLGKEPLPVLYLTHGYSDNEGTWTIHGKAHSILDALIASQKARPMLIVMPDAHAISPDGKKFDDYAPKNTEALCQEILQDIIPLVEENYIVSRNPADRAFAGLSMGGHHALTVALQYHEKFAYIGAFSAAPPKPEWVAERLKEVSTINENLKLLWVACGDKDFLFQRNEEIHQAFEDAGLRHDYVVTKGEDHSWPVWRRYLILLLPKLFQE